MFEYPENILPLPAPDLNFQPSYNNARTRMDSGRERVRPRTTEPVLKSPASFQLTKDQYSYFVGVWRHKLSNGTDWFTMRLPQPNGQTLTMRQVRFVGDYTAAHITFENWNISVDLELYVESVITEDELDLAILYDGDNEGLNFTVLEHYSKFTSSIPTQADKINLSSFVDGLQALDYYSDIKQFSVYGNRYNDDSSTQYALIGDDQSNAINTYDGARFIDTQIIDVADHNMSTVTTFIIWGTALEKTDGANSVFFSRIHEFGNIQSNAMLIYQGSDNELRSLQQLDLNEQEISGYNTGGSPGFDTRSAQAKVLGSTVNQFTKTIQTFGDGVGNTQITFAADPMTGTISRASMGDGFEFGGMLVIAHELSEAEHLAINNLIRSTVYKEAPVRTIYEGDSRIALGIPAPHWADRAKALDSVSSLDINDSNIATGGHTSQQVLDSMDAALGALTFYGEPAANRLLVCCGINGSAGTTGFPETVQTAAQQYATLVAIAAKAQGYGLFVEMCTIPKHRDGDIADNVGEYSGKLNELLDEINTLIRAGVGTDFDLLVDLEAAFEAAETTLPNPNARPYYDQNWGGAADLILDPTTLPFYVDSVHFETENGQATAGDIYATARISSQV